MAWCRQATNHCLNQCWPRSLPPYGVTRPQWVNSFWPNDVILVAQLFVIIGSGNGLLHSWHWAITWANDHSWHSRWVNALLNDIGIDLTLIKIDVYASGFIGCWNENPYKGNSMNSKQVNDGLANRCWVCTTSSWATALLSGQRWSS